MAPDIAPKGVNIPCPFQSFKGSYIEHLSDEVIDLILTRFGQALPSCRLSFNLSHYMHGEVCRVAPDTTAFDLRKEGAIDILFKIGWDDPKKASSCMSWLNKTFEVLQPYSGGRIYANYMSTEGGHLAKAVFGTNHTRLVQLKRKYDPKKFFPP
jgi:hypothetical protein